MFLHKGVEAEMGDEMASDEDLSDLEMDLK
jgi:hypothetical protein